jgi:hypothetical protein
LIPSPKKQTNECKKTRVKGRKYECHTLRPLARIANGKKEKRIRQPISVSARKMIEAKP